MHAFCVGRQKGSALAALVLLSAFAGGARADTLVVPVDHATIQQAVDAAADGDEILVRAGTYHEQLVISGRSNLLLKARGRVVLVPGLEETALVLEDCTGIRIEGLTLRFARTAIEVSDCLDTVLAGCRVEACEAGVEASGSPSLQVRGCSFRFVRGVAIENRVLGRAALALVEACSFRDIGSAVHLVGAGQTVRDNRIARCEGVAIVVEGEVGGSLPIAVEGNRLRDVGLDGILLERRGPLVARANAIARPGQSGIVVLNVTSGGVLVEGNVVRGAGNDGVALDFSTENGVIEANRVWFCRADGLDVRADGTAILGNRVVQAGRDGLFLSGDAAQVVGNVLVGAERFGVRLDGEGSLLVGNRAKGSAEADLFESVPGANVIGPSNEFGTVAR